jgi:hypothetical protein
MAPLPAQKAAEQLQQGGLALAVGAHDAHPVTGIQGEVQIGEQGCLAGIGKGQLAHAEHLFAPKGQIPES